MRPARCIGPSRGSSSACRRWIHADGPGDGDLLGLNKRGNLSFDLRGVGEATGVGVGLGDISAVVFLRTRLGVREAAAGDPAAERDAALSHGRVSSIAFSVCCFDDERDSTGVSVSSCD
jgi:hypothetical protein